MDVSSTSSTTFGRLAAALGYRHPCSHSLTAAGLKPNRRVKPVWLRSVLALMAQTLTAAGRCQVRAGDCLPSMMSAVSCIAFGNSLLPTADASAIHLFPPNAPFGDPSRVLSRLRWPVHPAFIGVRSASQAPQFPIAYMGTYSYTAPSNFCYVCSIARLSMSFTMSPFHVEVNPTVLVAMLTMAVHALQAYFLRRGNTVSRPGDCG